MKTLLVTAVVTFSGKTALALGIGLKLQEKGLKVGYLKPISTQPYMVEGKLVDEDSAFVGRVLGLDTPIRDLSTVIIDETLFEQLIEGKEQRDFAGEIKVAYEKAGRDKDVLLVEGGSSMREGYAIGLSSVSLAETLDTPTLGVVRYRNGLMLIDDILALQFRMEKHLLGTVINSVPAEAMDQIKNEVVPYLERRGVKIYGVLPHNRQLMAMSVGELIETLKAKVLTGADRAEALIENLTVGAMSAETALPRFRRSLNKAVITGGDRADLQAAALETSTTALILTGNLQPSSTIVKRAEELGVAVLLVPGNTMETVEAVEKVFGKTRLSQPEKLNSFKEILDANLDWTRLFADMGV
ncbi:MAG: phosphotransacetylase family protein [Chloroflexota bacterium]